MTNLQANLNIATLGSVSDGKSEMIYQLSGVRTQRDSREKKRNITIKAGYANIKLWICGQCNNQYSSNDIPDYQCKICNNKCILNNYISFTDCPGHQELIETMLTSISLVHAAIVVISVVDQLTLKPQLLQHLVAAKMANIEKIIICLNKCDLVTPQIVKQRKKELEIILDTLDIKPCIIIPTSFTQKLNISELIKGINYYFTPSEINNESSQNKSIFRITRSFDINKPGTDIQLIKGGCIGGSLINGIFKLNDVVEINPGILTKDKNGKYSCEPIITTLLSFESDKINITDMKKGGLIAIQSKIDPYYCKNDGLKGNIITEIGQSIPVYHDIKILFNKLDYFETNWIPKNGDKIFLQISNMFSEAKITKNKNNILDIQLVKPICIQNDSKILVFIKNPILKITGFGNLII